MILIGGTSLCPQCGRHFRVYKPKDMDCLYCYHDPSILQEPCSEGGKSFRAEVEMKEIDDAGVKAASAVDAGTGKKVPHV